MSLAEPKHYSVNIDARLEVGGQRLRVGQVCGDVLVLSDKASVPGATDAELVVTVRGYEKRYPIFLPFGINSDSDVTVFW